MERLVAIALIISFILPAQSAQAIKCSDFHSCSAAVKAWCSGLSPHADRNRNGIPCENRCRSVQQTKHEIRKLGSCPHVSNAYFTQLNQETAPLTCKSHNTCADVVKKWCAGLHPRADGDNDGIPCEDICFSLKQVGRERAKIGCLYK